MPRFVLSRPAARIGAWLLAIACVAVAGASAHAQIAAPDPLTPKLNADPRNPPRFETYTGSTRAQLNPPAAFAPPARGTGATGFDSTNARKAQGKAKPKPRAGTAATSTATTAPGAPAPLPLSPYQTPPPSLGGGALARAPGAPPVEDIGPIRRPPPKKRKAQPEDDDPYAPLGLRAGSFLVFPAVEIVGGYDTNPGRSANGSGAAIYSVMPEVQARSDWSRHELKASLRGSYTGYSPDETPTLSRPFFEGRVDGRIDVTRDTRIDTGGRLLVSTDNPGSPNLQAGLAKLPLFATYGGTLGLGQKFSRFDVSVKGDVERTAYQDSELTDGTTASNADRNYNQYALIARGGYEMTPGIIPFLEFSTDQRKHDLSVDPNGYERDSRGITGKAGTTFELSRLLTGEISLGYTQRSYDDPRFADLTGLIGDASLIWTANALTTVKFSAKSSVGESSIPGVSGILYREVGVQVDHAFRRWLIGTVKAGFGVDTYEGISTTTTTSTICDCVVSSTATDGVDREDTRFSLAAGLTYKASRNLHFKGEFRQEWLRSNVSGVDYTASTFLLGVRFQQ